MGYIQQHDVSMTNNIFSGRVVCKLGDVTNNNLTRHPRGEGEGEGGTEFVSSIPSLRDKCHVCFVRQSSLMQPTSVGN